MSEVLFFADQQEFDEWLCANNDASEIWVGYYKKSAGRSGPSWSETVDVALCHGWIDGIRKTVDAFRYKIRFSPRKSKSVWSKVNVEKAKTLIAQGKMKPAGLHVFNNRLDKKGYSSCDRNIPLSQEFEDQFRAAPYAWENFNRLAPSYKRDSIWWVMSAKREETRVRRLEVLIASSGKSLKIPLLRKK